LSIAALAAGPARAEIRRNPNGVNVNARGATTVFITFGGLADQVPVEAFWCGALLPAAPDIGFRCDPSTLFGQLPLRYDQSRLQGNAFTDIMSIPPSVSRRAYQAAQRGDRSEFFYVRRFVSSSGAPDEYVFVTCRLAGGGARVPLALLDVQLAFENGETVLSMQPGETPPSIEARITYNGTGRLKGRWEIVQPGDELPDSRDLLPAASLPVDERPLQRRYTQLQRFNVFLPPTGRITLPGPDVSRLPSSIDGLHLVLLRIEVSQDKEATSNLDAAGAGEGVVDAGAAAGFPMPVLRYFVGGAAAGLARGADTEPIRLLAPAPDAALPVGKSVEFSWTEGVSAVAYRIEIQDLQGQSVHAAVLQRGVGVYRAPTWLAERSGDGFVGWRVLAIGPTGSAVAETGWRNLKFE
jgi:hypothetical protein